jgi:ankyrin repeat protein
VQSLLGKVDPNEVNPVGGEPALVLAVREGAMRVLDVLLRHPGTNVDAPALNGNTALLMAAREGHEDSALFLLAQGADPQLKNGEGLTAAQIAQRADHGAIAAALDKRARQAR